MVLETPPSVSTSISMANKISFLIMISFSVRLRFNIYVVWLLTWNQADVQTTLIAIHALSSFSARQVTIIMFRENTLV